ncbi:hypothetical protein [Mesoplasma melaleucae]|nr:hypothetical protein [Mesoplasma melaleucae]
MLGQTTFIVQSTIEGKNYKWDDASITNKTFEIVANIDERKIIDFN